MEKEIEKFILDVMSCKDVPSEIKERGGNLISNANVKTITNKMIADEIMVIARRHFDLGAFDSLSSRKREVVEARQICMYVIRRETTYSFTKIGELFGGKHHATVLHACETISNLIETDKKFENRHSNILGYKSELLERSL